MAKCEWLYCNSDWNDLINIIKLEKNPSKRLEEFNFLLNIDGDNLTINDVVDNWTVLTENDIENAANEWFYNYDIQEGIDLGHVTYWFFNIYTGKAVHIKYSVSVSCSDIITD